MRTALLLASQCFTVHAFSQSATLSPSLFASHHRNSPSSRRLANSFYGDNDNDDSSYQDDSPPSRWPHLQRRAPDSSGYTRDPLDDTNVNLSQIHTLLSARERARKSRSFDVADGIRDELLQEHGVRVSDSKRQFRTGCNPQSGSGMNPKWGRDDNLPSRDFAQRSPRDFSPRSSPRDRSSRSPPNRFSEPGSHDYTYSPDAGPFSSSIMSEQEANEAIAERLQCKFRRDYRQADMIQQDLEEAGIYVNDREREWRADGNMFQRSAGYSSAYSEAPGSKSEGNGGVIQELVDQRAAMKKVRNFQAADAIQNDLREKYEVEINDKTKQWSVGIEFASNVGIPRNDEPYQPSSSCIGLPDQEAIQKMVDDRNQARKMRQYDVADGIRDELMDEYGVEVHDRMRQWTVDGKFDFPERPDEEPYREGDTAMMITKEDPALAAEIQALIDTRDSARKARNFDVADNIKTQLLNEYEIQINDRKRLWRKAGPDPSTTGILQLRGSSGSLTPDQIATIEGLIAERATAKANRDYNRADEIRDTLGEEFGVGVDDRQGVWMVSNAGYVQDPVVLTEEDESLAEITQQLKDRSVAKFKRDYDTADQIRETLMEDYNVIIDDRGLTWTIGAGGVLGTRLEYADNGMELPAGVREEVVPTTSVEETYSDLEQLLNNDVVAEADVSDDVGAAEDLSLLKVPELKDRLREAGLPVSGRKAELIERLLQQH